MYSTQIKQTDSKKYPVKVVIEIENFCRNEQEAQKFISAFNQFMEMRT